MKNIFITQTDPWTKGVSKKRVIAFAIFVFLIFLVLVSVFSYKPEEKTSGKENDQKRISDLSKLKEALIAFQKDSGWLPQLSGDKRFLIGGKGSPNRPDNNWLAVDLSKYLATVPVDPKFSANSTAPYAYRYTTDGFSFKLDAYLETNANNLMQLDGGILNDPGTPLTNRARYEVGTNLFLRF